MNRPSQLHRLRRSLHFVPGANEAMLHKSIATHADCLILDLEDAVTPDGKEEARNTISDWLVKADFQGKERCVRINALDTPWALEDLEVVMRFPPEAIVVPKVSTLAEIESVAQEIGRLETVYGHPPMSVGLILVSTETPTGALQVSTFADCARVVGMTWGAEDLASSLGATANRDANNRYLPLFEYCRSMTLLSAAAGGAQPIDSVYVDYGDDDGLLEECQLAATMGFTGKLTIHPNQIDIVNAAFSPSAADVADAQRLIAAFEDARAVGRMAFSFEGKMVDAPHLDQARKLLARAEQVRLQTR